jgi:hypothetical protein
LRTPKAFDPKPDNIAVAQLVHLHADLGGRLLACQAHASRLASDMRLVMAWNLKPQMRLTARRSGSARSP